MKLNPTGIGIALFVVLAESGGLRPPLANGQGDETGGLRPLANAQGDETGGLRPPLANVQTPAARDEAGRVEFFEKKIRPLLVNNCYNCHSANTNSQGGLRVDDRNGLLTGGGRG